MNGLFLFCLALTALVIFRGWRRGIIGLAYGIGSWIFIAVFVTMANPLVYNYFYDNEDIHDAVYDRVYPYADSYIPQITAQVELPARLADATAADEYKDVAEKYLNGDAEIPDEYKEAVEKYRSGDAEGALDELEKKGVTVPEKYQNAINALKNSGIDINEFAGELQEKGVDLGEISGSLSNSVKESAADIRKAAVETLAEKVTSYVLKAMAVVIVYLIAKVLCLLVKLMLSIVTSAGPIRFAVHVTGAAVGVIESLLYIWIILFVISLTQVTEWGASLYEQVEANPILLLLYENNALANFLGNLLQKTF